MKIKITIRTNGETFMTISQLYSLTVGQCVDNYIGSLFNKGNIFEIKDIESISLEFLD